MDKIPPVSSPESLTEGQFVFAQKYGYMTWPARLESKLSTTAIVMFISTEDKHRIPYAKIWPYNRSTRKEFVTQEFLEYEEFRDAIYLAERMIAGVNGCQFLNDDSWSLAAIPKGYLPSIPKAGALTKEQRELAYLLEVRKERDSLHVEVKFIDEINKLRSSLTITRQDYASASLAFHELLELPVCQLLLVRNFEAVNSVRRLCHFALREPSPRLLPQVHHVRTLARKLMGRFAACVPLPYNTPDFWSEFSMLSGIYRRYTVEIAAAPKQNESVSEEPSCAPPTDPEVEVSGDPNYWRYTMEIAASPKQNESVSEEPAWAPPTDPIAEVLEDPNYRRYTVEVADAPKQNEFVSEEPACAPPTDPEVEVSGDPNYRRYTMEVADAPKQNESVSEEPACAPPTDPEEEVSEDPNYWRYTVEIAAAPKQNESVSEEPACASPTDPTAEVSEDAN